MVGWSSDLTVLIQKDIIWVLLLCQLTWVKEIIGRKPEGHLIEVKEKKINFQNT